MHDIYDERGVPISSGIPPLVVAAAIVGVIVIFTMLTLVFVNSAFGHAWPASTSTTIKLP
ncbi:MAG: hypothetical protein M3R44_04850 [Candidatus Eremiobacteraeota bacterium]|nr:hypothetical protein [Candidatus Eremiobacteraeota bacterium]